MPFTKIRKILNIVYRYKAITPFFFKTFTEHPTFNSEKWFPLREGRTPVNIFFQITPFKKVSQTKANTPQRELVWVKNHTKGRIPEMPHQ